MVLFYGVSYKIGFAKWQKAATFVYPDMEQMIWKLEHRDNHLNNSLFFRRDFIALPSAPSIPHPTLKVAISVKSQENS